MRNLILPLAIALAAMPAAASAAPKIGQRTAAPRQIAPNAADPEAEMRDAIAAADQQPLGSTANPVRVAGPEGERAYLARLRCVDGKVPDIIPQGRGGAGPYGSLLDLYSLDCGAVAPGRVAVAMDMYQEEHVETRPLPGFQAPQR